MRFAISIPQHVPDGTFDPAAMRGYLARAEELGFASAWTQEQVFGTIPHLGPVETLTYAAACTEPDPAGLRRVHHVAAQPGAPGQEPEHAGPAQPGRLEVGIGTGGRHRMFSAFGVDRATYVARFNEGLRLMRALWTEPTVNFGGGSGSSTAPPWSPSRSRSPARGSGSAAATRRRCGARSGTGTASSAPGRTRTAQFAKQVQIVRAELADQGRDPATFPIAKRVYIAVDDDAERARERMRAALDRLYGFFGLGDMTPVSVWGTPDACVRGLQDVADAGAELILLNPLFDDARADGTSGSGGSAAAIVMRSRGTHTGDAWLNASCFRTPRGAS